MSKKRCCIKCNKEMIAKQVEEVEVDWCPACHGLWLDRDEIYQLRAKADEDLQELRELVGPKEGEAPAPSSAKKPCPACSGKLAVAALGKFNLEYCIKCGGIFLDRGELDKMIELTMSTRKPIATIVAMASSVVTSGSVGS